MCVAEMFVPCGQSPAGEIQPTHGRDSADLQDHKGAGHTLRAGVTVCGQRGKSQTYWGILRKSPSARRAAADETEEPKADEDDDHQPDQVDQTTGGMEQQPKDEQNYGQNQQCVDHRNISWEEPLTSSWRSSCKQVEFYARTEPSELV
jgi:hypothetical protein